MIFSDGKKDMFQNLKHEALACHDEDVPQVVGYACGADSDDQVL